ncbi:MAG: hypothetical protein ABEI74_02095 [Candidatus Pacearchaeota archaeon]
MKNSLQSKLMNIFQIIDPELQLEIYQDKEFRSLDLEQLSQTPINLNNHGRRKSIERTFRGYLSSRKSNFNNPYGIEILKNNASPSYLSHKPMGNTRAVEMVPGIYRHDGSPVEGDSVAYLNNKKELEHLGVYQGSGFVKSKWERDGPVVLHRLGDVPRIFGDFALFSDYSFE